MKRTRQGEAQLSDAIREALRFEPGLFLMRNNLVAIRRAKSMARGGCGVGSADLIGCLDGRFVGLEVKMPGKVPGPVDWKRIAAKTGQVVVQLDSPAFKAALKKLDPDDRRIVEQAAWAHVVRGAKGFAAVVDSVESARAAIARARTGACS